MDYASIHGQDESNFTFRSQHRLPTQSASQALHALKNGGGGGNGAGTRITLGKDMKGVDGLLSSNGGVRRGVVTEVWGPSGVGKTALGMELAANALKGGGKVLWLSCQDPIPGPRFVQVLSKVPSPPNPPSPHFKYITTSKEKQMLQNFTHLPWPTIVYLSWKLLLSDDPTSGWPEPGTSLFVIDKLDELIDKQSPRDLPEDPDEKQKRGNKPPEALLNYWKTTHHAIRMLNKFAAKHNVAVVLLTPIDVKDHRMCPAIDTQAWEMGIATRIMLWRQDMGDKMQDVRLGRTAKKDGVVGKGEVFGFNITETGLQQVPVFLHDRDDQNYRQYEARQWQSVASHAIQQRESKAEGGWDVEEPEEGYGSADEYGDIPGHVRDGQQSPLPPSSPPLPASHIASQAQTSNRAHLERTPSPSNVHEYTQNGTPVKNVSASNLFAQDPTPLWDDEAPSVSFVGAGGVMPHHVPDRAVATAADTSRRHLGPVQEMTAEAYVQMQRYQRTKGNTGERM